MYRKWSSLLFLCLFSTNTQPPLLPIGSKINWTYFCCYQFLLPSICYQSCQTYNFQTTVQLTLLILHMNEGVIWLKVLTTHKTSYDTTQSKTRVSRYFPETLTILPDWQNSLSLTLLLINSSVWKAHPVGRIHKADNELSRCLGLKAVLYLIACFECSNLMF